MEIVQLASFLCVADTSSVSRAAEIVHLTQPAVTKQIQALERELKTPLFDRTGRGVELTAAGATLRDYAGRSLALLKECQQVITDLDTGAAGQLVIGAGATTSIFRLPRWLQSLQTVLPGIDIVVRTGDSREVVSLTLDRQVELGLITTPVQHPDLAVSQLFDEEIVLVASPLSPPTAASSPSGATLDGHTLRLPLILFPCGSGFREYLERKLAAAGIEIHVKMETDSVEAIKSFVAIGLGASFLPFGAVAAELTGGVLQQVQVSGLPPLHRHTAVIRRKDRRAGMAAQALLEILQDSCVEK
ncbi:MAG: LysR family transcriptional regulator [Abitibacteriaceae bacterium]|nr:LysR family transcriptional regulator [Abditibacteriaceae bacterium]